MKKIIEPKDSKELNDLLKCLNFCHDGSMRRISFIKQREISKDGSLVYPFEDKKDFVNCNIEMELILNSFKGAKRDQIVLFEFKDANTLFFRQDMGFDYSDIYEAKFKETAEKSLNFIFYSTGNKIESLSIICRKLIVKIN